MALSDIELELLEVFTTLTTLFIIAIKSTDFFKPSAKATRNIFSRRLVVSLN